MVANLQGPFGLKALDVPTLTIGSAPDNQLVLSDASVMAHHAQVRPEGQGHCIIDLGSNTGTFVNEQQIYPNIPQMLQSGDAVRIGNIRLAYEVTGEHSIPPTVYANPSQQTIPPTVYATPGYQDMPAYPPPAAPSSFTPPPPPLVQTPPAQKRSRRGLWITLGVIVGVLVVGVILLVVVVGRGPSTTPTQAFQAYCSALKTHNGQAIYDMYTANAGRQLGINSASDAQNSFSTLNDCTVSKVDDNAHTGVVVWSLQNVGKLSFNDTLVDDNGTWKIDAQTPLSSPTRTLYDYCVAVLKGDYQAAYNLYTQTGQSAYGSEAKYAASYSEKPSDCSLSNVDDVAGKGMVTMKFSNGSGSWDETLVKENGTWKIDNEQVHSTPTLTLTTYCNALKQGDYQTAYNQLNSDQQGLQTEAQFAANFSSNQIAACSVSNVDDTAGTGTITYTGSNGNTAVADYTLVQENGVWKIKTEKVRQ